MNLPKITALLLFVASCSLTFVTCSSNDNKISCGSEGPLIVEEDDIDVLYTTTCPQGHNEIFGMTADGTIQVSVTPIFVDSASGFLLSFPAAFPSWHPEGRFYACQFNDEALSINHILIATMKNRTLLQLAYPDTIEQSFSTHPDWNRQGTKVVFASNRNSSVLNLYCFNTNVVGDSISTDSLIQLSDNDFNEFAPNWSPDGTKIIFMSEEGGIALNDGSLESDIWQLDVVTGERTKLLETEVVEQFPHFSPDGSKIVFAGIKGTDSGNDNAEIWVMNADGTGLRMLTDNKREDNTPNWTPDGNIIYSSINKRRTKRNLKIMTPDGVELQQITDIDRGGNVSPSWQLPLLTN